MNGRRTKENYFEILELRMWSRVFGKVVQARNIALDCKCSLGCFERVNEQCRTVGSWFLTSSGLSPIMTYKMLTCSDRWNPKSLQDGIATGKVWRVSRDEPGREVQCSGCLEQSHGVPESMTHLLILVS